MYEKESLNSFLVNKDDKLNQILLFSEHKNRWTINILKSLHHLYRINNCLEPCNTLGSALLNPAFKVKKDDLYEDGYKANY
jgi:hypothetical protein